MLGFNAIVADTDEEAELLATSVQQAFRFAANRSCPIQLPPPKKGYVDELPLEARAILRLGAIGVRDRKLADRPAPTRRIRSADQTPMN